MQALTCDIEWNVHYLASACHQIRYPPTHIHTQTVFSQLHFRLRLKLIVNRNYNSKE